jgi:chromosome segregation ATPase
MDYQAVFVAERNTFEIAAPDYAAMRRDLEAAHAAIEQLRRERTALERKRDELAAEVVASNRRQNAIEADLAAARRQAHDADQARTDTLEVLTAAHAQLREAFERIVEHVQKMQRL